MLRLILLVYICNLIALSKITGNEENDLIFLRYFRSFKCHVMPYSLFGFSTLNNPANRVKSQSVYRFNICLDRCICCFQNYEKINSFGFIYFDCFNEFDLDQYFDRSIFRNSFGSHIFWGDRNDHWTFDQLQITQKTQSLKSITHGK